MSLLERERARGLVAASLELATQGKPSVLFLEGEPGLGKTTLLAECCSSASGFVVRRAGCSELEESVPFGLLDRLVTGLDAPRAASGTEVAGSAEARLRRYTGTLDWLRSSAPCSLLLAIDDLHWADRDSVELLSMVCRRLDGLRVAVVATTRPWPSVALDQARSLVHDRLATLERLQPLSAAASAALLKQLSGTELPAGFVQAARRACAGNPMLLSELVNARLRGEDLLGATSGALGDQVFLPRFAGVGAPGLRWARAASVLGTRFRPDLVSRLSGQSVAEAAEAAETLHEAGLVCFLTDGLAEFVHPLFRQALYEDLAPPVRNRLHASALATLLDEGAAPCEAAPHALGAQLKGDPKAIAVLVATGRQAMKAGAVASAAEHFQAALGLAGALPDPGLLLELSQACLLTGRVDLVDEALTQLLVQPNLADSYKVAGLRLQARVLLASARYPEAKRRFEQASDQAANSDADLAAEVLLDGAFVGQLFEGPREARKTVRRALRIMETSGSVDQALRLAALTADGHLACLGGDTSYLDAMATAAHVDLELDRYRSAWSWDVVYGYASLANLTERFEDSQLLFGSLINAADRQGATLTLHTVAIGLADTLWRLGRLGQARRLAADAADLAELVPTLGTIAWVALAHISHEQGDNAESAHWAARVETALSHIGESPYLRLWLCLFDCRNLLRAGRTHESVLAAERAASTADEYGILEPCLVPWHGAAIEAHVAANQLDKAGELVASLEEVSGALPCRAPRAVAAWGGALVAWRRGDVEGAQVGFEDALAHTAAVPMPLAQAEALIAYGRFLRRTGRPARAREVLHRALAVLEPTGAGRLRAIAHEELAGAGGRRRRPISASDLTPKEDQVARLAEQGLTNSKIAQVLFLSAKTVDHHLSRIYTKLGIGSRRELTQARQDRDGSERVSRPTEVESLAMPVPTFRASGVRSQPPETNPFNER